MIWCRIKTNRALTQQNLLVDYLVAFVHISDYRKVICCFHLFKDLTKIGN